MHSNTRMIPILNILHIVSPFLTLNSSEFTRLNNYSSHKNCINLRASKFSFCHMVMVTPLWFWNTKLFYLVPLTFALTCLFHCSSHLKMKNSCSQIFRSHRREILNKHLRSQKNRPEIVMPGKAKGIVGICSQSWTWLPSLHMQKMMMPLLYLLPLKKYSFWLGSHLWVTT